MHGGSATEHVWHSDFQPGRSERQSTPLLGESLDQQIIDKSIDHWRNKLNVVV